ncbi:type II toxin-antitoxin system VapC family toxin [Candidatus Woesearchaeota archaeon]|nr:type II toxin-antitoxin system VapC family toxin [Candidatus Woesearchaeota archaeon]
MTKFVDANIIIDSWSDPAVKKLVSEFNKEEYATSVLALAEAYHKLQKKGIENLFELFRELLANITVYDVSIGDFFNAIKSNAPLSINDKLHIEVMKRHDISTIISFDKDFDKVKTITREAA